MPLIAPWASFWSSMLFLSTKSRWTMSQLSQKTLNCASRSDGVARAAADEAEAGRALAAIRPPPNEAVIRNRMAMAVNAERIILSKRHLLGPGHGAANGGQF